MEALGAGGFFGMVGICVTLPFAAILGGIMFFCWRGIQKTQQQSAELRDAPFVDIKELRNGLHKIEGKINAQDDLIRSPLSRKKCVYYRFHVEELRNTGHGRHQRQTWVTVIDDKQWIDFNIDDGTGEAEVNVEAAEVTLKSKAFTNSGTFNDAPEELEELLQTKYGQSTTGWFGLNKNMRYTESYLRDGDTVMIVGDCKAKKGKNPEFIKGESHLLITDMDEKQIASVYSGRATGYWIGLVFCGLMMLFVCGFGGFFGIMGITVGAGVGAIDGIKDRIAKDRFDPFKDQNDPFKDNRKDNFDPFKDLNKDPFKDMNKDKDKNAKKDQLVKKDPNPAWNEATMAKTWLSDIPESNVRVGWGRYGKNGKLGYEPGGDPNKDADILMDGQPFTKSISFHPPDSANPPCNSGTAHQLPGKQKLRLGRVDQSTIDEIIANAGCGLECRETWLDLRPTPRYGPARCDFEWIRPALACRGAPLAGGHSTDRGDGKWGSSTGAI